MLGSKMFRTITFFIIIFFSSYLNNIILASEEIVLEADDVRSIYAFHVTYKLPENGVMISGKVNNDRLKEEDKGKPLYGILGWRPTIHFSLASLCPDSNENNLSTRNHVIIVKIRDLESQLIGLQPFDSFVMGNFVIPQGSSVIVPDEEVETAKNCDWVLAKNLTVIGREGRLITRAQSFLVKHQGWIFRGTDETQPISGLKLKPIRQEVSEVRKTCFSKFLEQARHVEYARHTQHRIGFLDKNVPYLFCKKNNLDIPGQDELRDLFDRIGLSYKDF